MRRIYIQFVAFLFIFLLTFGTIQNPYTTSYVEQLKQTGLTVTKQKDPLYLEIEEKASQFEVQPQNAEIHKVWKATPGYNGLKVDVKRSYESMKKSGEFDPKKLVYDQVSPAIHLSDLPPSPIYRGNPNKPMVSFLINVAWGNEYIPDMLEVLKKHDVSATFFLEGRWVKENPELAKMIVDSGHEVGNHSYSHPNLKTMGSEEIREQLVKTNEVIEATTGQKITWFAPPSGNFRDEVIKIAAQLNMGTVMWSVDTIDWKRPTPEVLVNRVMTKIHPGALILMHPTSSTAQALDALIASIKQKGFKISSVSRLLSEERIIQN